MTSSLQPKDEGAGRDCQGSGQGNEGAAQGFHGLQGNIFYMLLAGDVGGTKTLLGLFEPAGERPRSLVVREYTTLDFDSLEELIQVFLDDTRAESQLRGFCLGVAGPGEFGQADHAPEADFGVAGVEDPLPHAGCPVLVVAHRHVAVRAVDMRAEFDPVLGERGRGHEHRRPRRSRGS